METNVINATEKITKAASGKNVKTAGGIGAALVGLGLVYELLIKPSRAKKKNQEAVEVVDTDEDDDVDDVEITAF